MDEMLTTAEALKLLKVARSTLYRWIEEGKIQTYNLAGVKKFISKGMNLTPCFNLTR